MSKKSKKAKNILKQAVDYLERCHPTKILMGGYGVVVLAGFVLLSLPWVKEQPVTLVDTLFMAVSNVSTTGLITHTIPENYNIWGQVIIAALIQVGGLGYMIFASFTLLVIRQKVSSKEKSIIKSEFSLPQNFNIYHFIASVVIFSFIIELAGAVCLFFIFLNHQVPNPLWNAVFHSISIFCTAGFDLTGESFIPFRSDPALNIVTTVMCYIGGIGFIVISDVWQRAGGSKKNVTYTTTVILKFTAFVAAAGIAAFYFLEPSVRSMPFGERLMVSVFQIMTAQNTAGFNTVDISGLSPIILFLITVIMITGASPAGTGGGIKSTTVVAVMAQMFSVLKGRKSVLFGRGEIPAHRVRLANVRFSFYIMLLSLGLGCLFITETARPMVIIFEAASALGTVGLSMGLTPELTDAGKLCVILLMFAGRLGPLTLGTALFFHKSEVSKKRKLHDLAI